MAETPATQFTPFPPEVARGLAHAAKEAYAALPTDPNERKTTCPLCLHTNREEIDRLLLFDAALKHLRTAAGLIRGYDLSWPDLPFKRHRDKHLLPLIAALRNVQMALQAPFPRDGSEQEKEWWHFMQFYAIREKALADGNLKVAIECQRLLRQSDVFLRIVKDPKLVEKYGSSFGIGGTANMPVLTGRDEHDERLERAFSRSVAKPPPEEDPIDVEATPAGTED